MGRPIRTWNFDYLEFAVRWNGLTGEHLPNPLMIVTNFESNDKYLAECRRIAAALDADPDVDEMLKILALPDLALRVHGLIAPDTGDERAIRLYAARDRGRCFVVEQQPGETIYHASSFTVTECVPAYWTAAVAARLPGVGAGRRAVVPLAESDSDDISTGEMDYSFGRSGYRDSFDDSFDEHQKFLDSPVTAVGVIDIAQGKSAFGPAGRTRRTVGWRDVADDGRYVIAYRRPYIARGLDTPSLVSFIDEEIEEIQLVIDDEQRSVAR